MFYAVSCTIGNDRKRITQLDAYACLLDEFQWQYSERQNSHVSQKLQQIK